MKSFINQIYPVQHTALHLNWGC